MEGPHLECVLPPELVLRHIIILTRHGDRAPISRSIGTFKVDDNFWKDTLPPKEDVARWDEMHPVEDMAPVKRLDHAQEVFGQLTARGAEQLRALGNILRIRLQTIAPHLLDPLASLTARSTNLRRTIQSAQNFLCGFEAPAKIQVREWADENLVPNVTRCPPLGSVLKAADAAEQTQAADDAPALKKQLAATFSLDPDRPLPISKIREILVCVLAHHQPLPPGLSAETVTQVVELDAHDWGRRHRPMAVVRLGMGPLLDELRAGLRAVVEGDTAGGVALFSGHDTTLVALLCALGVFDDRPADYGAHLVLELAEDDLAAQFYVRVLYNWQPLPLLTSAAHATEWIEWSRFETNVLAHALNPAQYAAALEAATAAMTPRGNGLDQGSSDAESAAMALQSMQDVLVGSM